MKRYAINENGEIFDDGIKLIPEFIDGFLKVKFRKVYKLETLDIYTVQLTSNS